MPTSESRSALVVVAAALGGIALLLVTVAAGSGIAWARFGKPAAEEEAARARPRDAYVPPRGYVCYRAATPLKMRSCAGP